MDKQKMTRLEILDKVEKVTIEGRKNIREYEKKMRDEEKNTDKDTNDIIEKYNNVCIHADICPKCGSTIRDMSVNYPIVILKCNNCNSTFMDVIGELHAVEEIYG